MKQLAILVISSSPSLENIAQNFKPLVLAKSPHFSPVILKCMVKAGLGQGFAALK